MTERTGVSFGRARRCRSNAQLGPEHASSISLAMGLTTMFDHHLGLSTEIRLSAKSLFSRKIGRLRTLLDTLPMSGGPGGACARFAAGRAAYAEDLLLRKFAHLNP